MERLQLKQKENLVYEILKLKQTRNAIILAHNYQDEEIQDISDYTGDSLNLSKKAADTNADVIVFCGVNFMAETAAILSPEKTVLLPDPDAGCSLADTINKEQLLSWKMKYPNAVVVSYINTTAEIKAESDYCCTSTNALNVINAIPIDKEILFLPDIYLGTYLETITGRKFHLWPGECHVHANIRPSSVNNLREQYPEAVFLVHPECGCLTPSMYYLANGDISSKDTHILSTEGMIRYAKESYAKRFIIATEVGILNRMKKENPDKKFLPVNPDSICKYMKMTTLETVYTSLKEMIYQVKVPENIALKARISIDRMLEVS